MIDDEIKNTVQENIDEQTFYLRGYYTEKDNEKINVRLKYCHPRDVNLKRQRELMYKAKFYQKIVHLKCQGKKTEIMNKTFRWLETNID
jgi:hypothetical protein